MRCPSLLDKANQGRWMGFDDYGATGVEVVVVASASSGIILPYYRVADGDVGRCGDTDTLVIFIAQGPGNLCN